MKRALEPAANVAGVAKKLCSGSGALTVEEYRARLDAQGKYQDCKPGSRSLDGCLKDPPTLPPKVVELDEREDVPKRGADGCFAFPDFPSFKPNLSPSEVMQLGSFGGTYFRDITSAVDGKKYKGRDVISEFPQDWFKGVDVDLAVCSPNYSKQVNQYKVACGASLGQWECSGWISHLDPYGWFQWYCRFFLGRRTSDDDRQVDRWAKGQGPTGRWRVQLCNEIVRKGAKFDDVKVRPVLRQVLQHWAYKLTSADLENHPQK